ncbi:MAG: Tetratricopeptide 2 repeat protein [Bryobacterales bacterium]|jgi:tetratricopeptide (TPR) repeat protein|nr:Tetratricopeptide 2 repeat protein [Bryobacterales bacterium]
MRIFRALVLLVAAAASVFAAGDPREDALDLFYNLDFDEALVAFEKLLAASPNDPELHNHVAHTLLFRELLRNGALESQMVSGNNSFIRRMKMEPPPDVEKRFFAEIERTISITQGMLARNPKDTTAMQAQAVAYALRANYGFLVRKSWMASLGDASKAYKLDNQVISIDPSIVDAKLLVGGYDYIIGNLTWHMRMIGAVAGFHGDKDRGLRTMEMVARQGKKNKRDAQITLCALYRREGQTARAIPMLLEVSEAYPRNYLFRFELAQMYAAIGERSKALAILDDIRSRKDHNLPGYARIPSEKIYYETGNLMFWFNDLDRSLQNLRKVTGSREQLKELDLNTGALAFMRQGQIHDLQNRHDLAAAAYQQAIQFAPDAEAAKESQKYIDNPYKRPQRN